MSNTICMRLYQKIITGGLLVAGLAGLIGCKESSNQQKNNIPTTSDGASIVSADFNKDGYSDLMLCDGRYNSPIQLMLGNGDGGYNIRKLEVTTSDRTSMVAGDFNGDGNTDVLLCDGRYNSPIQLLVNDGRGNFSARKYEGITTADNTALTTSDFDKDGDLDAVLQDGRYSSPLKLLRNDGRGNFSVENLLK